jgi:hypothetical protein
MYAQWRTIEGYETMRKDPAPCRTNSRVNAP